jgi:hypothetical protein
MINNAAIVMRTVLASLILYCYIPDFFPKIVHPGKDAPHPIFINGEYGDTLLPHPYFFQQRIHFLGSFRGSQVPFKIVALIFFAGYQHQAVRALFKGFNKVKQIGFAGTGETDVLIFNSFFFMKCSVEFINIQTVGAVKDV